MTSSKPLRIAATLFLLVFSCGFVRAETPCAELNRLYKQKYIEAFSIDTVSFAIDPGRDPLFKCNGFDKNYIVARAIDDLDRLRPQSASDPDYYEAVSQVYRLKGTSLRYVPTLTKAPDAEALAYQEDGQTAVFLTDKMIRSKERFRPTYSLVHEARHVIKGQPNVPDEPDHVMCTQGKHKGKIACDRRLSKEDKLVWGSGNSAEFLFLLTVRNNPKASARIRREAKAQLSYLATHMFNGLAPGILDYYGVELER